MELDSKDVPARPEARLESARLVRRPERQDEDEPVVEIVRVVGPGRIERRYQAEIAALAGSLASYEEHLASLEGSLAARARELAAAELVERGSRARLDRLELEAQVDAELLRESRARERSLEAEARRMCAALGALARENELLREAEAQRLAGPAPRALSAGPPPRASSRPAGSAHRRARAAEPQGWLGRLFWRGRA